MQIYQNMVIAHESYSIYLAEPFNPSLPHISQLCKKFIIANINMHQSKD